MRASIDHHPQTAYTSAKAPLLKRAVCFPRSGGWSVARSSGVALGRLADDLRRRILSFPVTPGPGCVTKPRVASIFWNPDIHQHLARRQILEPHCADPGYPRVDDISAER